MIPIHFVCPTQLSSFLGIRFFVFTNLDFYLQFSNSFKGFWSKNTTFFKTLTGDELYQALFTSQAPENYTLLSRERRKPV